MSEELKPASVHDANVFLPGGLGPVRREVVLAYEHDRVVDQLRDELRAHKLERVWLESVKKERNALRTELAALKAGQGEAVAWVIVVPGTTFKSVGFSTQLQDLPVGTELYTAPPASADAVSVPGEFPAADDHEKAIGWEYSYEFISQVERLVASRTEFTTSMESVQETLKAACELRALLARQEVKS